jgi:hypothetical protein
MTHPIPYRYFVDLGIFLTLWQATNVFSDAMKAGNTGIQQKSKEALFPETTNYR